MAGWTTQRYLFCGWYRKSEGEPYTASSMYPVAILSRPGIGDLGSNRTRSAERSIGLTIQILPSRAELKTAFRSAGRTVDPTAVGNAPIRVRHFPPHSWLFRDYSRWNTFGVFFYQHVEWSCKTNWDRAKQLLVKNENGILWHEYTGGSTRGV